MKRSKKLLAALSTLFLLTGCSSEDFMGPQGPKGDQGEPGLNGHDGIDGQDGTNGQDGRGITSVTKVSTVGNVDTYIIIFTDATTLTFTVTNGVNGQSIKGDKGEDGKTPVITIGNNGNWFIDGVDSGKRVEGLQGDAGLTAYEIYLKYHPEWEGTEQQWLDTFYHDPSKDVFAVSFLDFDNTLLYTTSVKYGEKASYIGKDPIRLPDLDYKYTFIGWDKEFEPITCDTVYFAQYEKTAYSNVCEHIDDNHDHHCDKCGEVLSTHYDYDFDHDCDFCGEILSEHRDLNHDHYCEYCGLKFTEHLDSDKNHYCDICEAQISEHIDENNDNYCDICKEFLVPDSWFLVTIDSSLVNAGVTVLPGLDNSAEIIEDNFPSQGNCIHIIRNLEIHEGFTAKIEWDFSITPELVKEIINIDSEWDLVRVNFSQTTQLLVFTIKSIEIGGVTKTYDELNKIFADAYPNERLVYGVYCKPATHIYDSVPVSYFSKLNNKEMGYECIDYSGASPHGMGFKTNNDGYYFYCTVKGKIVYVAADYDFFILADGDFSVNVFIGSFREYVPLHFPEVKVNNYVEIRGNLSQYNSGFQMTFINRVRKLTEEEKASITEPTGYKNLTEEEINSWKIENGKHNFVVEGLMGSLKSVTGTFVPGSLKTDTGTIVSSMTQNRRHTFKLQVGDEVLDIAYDYHTSTSATEGLIVKLNNNIARSTKITIMGYMLYLGTSITDVAGSGSGVWRLVPLDTTY